MSSWLLMGITLLAVLVGGYVGMRVHRDERLAMQAEIDYLHDKLRDYEDEGDTLGPWWDEEWQPEDSGVVLMPGIPGTGKSVQLKSGVQDWGFSGLSLK